MMRRSGWVQAWFRTSGRAVLTMVSALLLGAAGVRGQAAAAARQGGTPPRAQNDALRTVAEKTEFKQTSRYEDVVRLMEAAQRAAPALLRMDTFGYTFEGRALPLMVVGHLRDKRPETVRASGRTVVYLQGNIHAGEVEGKESLQILLRELTQGQHGAWLDSLVLLIAPIYNADGNERILLTNRGVQNGPIGGMGQRPNAQDYDLNRDHMKLESPEARSLAGLLTRYDPQVAVDLHTTDGTRMAYYVTYSGPMHPNTDSALVRMLRQRWFPEMTKTLHDKYHWDYYYYGNVERTGDQRGWYTFDYRPRFNNNYIGLRNRFAILSEAYAYATFEDRIKATSRFVEEIVNFAMHNATAIRRTTAAADAAPIVGRQFALRADFERSDPVDILLGDVTEERNPYSGARMLRRADVTHVERMPEYGTYTPTETERVPRAYLIPPALADIVDKLQAHGVKTTVLATDRQLRVEKFRIDSTTAETQPFQGHQERTLYGAWEASTETVPAGTVVASVEQPLGRLMFTLLEPRSDDGFVDWNLLDRDLGLVAAGSGRRGGGFGGGGGGGRGGRGGGGGGAGAPTQPVPFYPILRTDESVH